MISLARYTEHNCHALIYIYLWLVKSLRLLTNALVPLLTEERDQNKGWPSEKDAQIIITCPCMCISAD